MLLILFDPAKASFTASYTEPSRLNTSGASIAWEASMPNKRQSISRRTFLRSGTLVVGATAGALTAPGVTRAQPSTVLKLQTSWPASDIFHEMVQQYVDRVHEMSGGRLQIDLLPAGSVVGAFDVQDAVADGALDGAHTVPAYWYGKHKGASLFGTGPVWGGDAASLLSWFYAGGGSDLYRELTQEILGLNIVGFFGFPMPAQPLGWFKNEITSAEQLKGLKYRTIGLAADLFQAMGVTVTQLPGAEIVPAMDRGVIDAFEFNNPTSDMRFGAQDVAKNYMLASYHQATEMHEFMFNKDFFERLDSDLQAILRYGVEAASTANYALGMKQYSRDLQKLISDHGVRVRRTPNSILQAQLDAWDELIPHLEEDDFVKRVMDSQRAWVQETAFYQLQGAPDYNLAYVHHFPNSVQK